MSTMQLNAVRVLEFDDSDLSVQSVEEIKNLVEDVLVLSTTLYRLSKETPDTHRGRSISWDHDQKYLVERITDQDRKLAEEIRTDFRKKLSYFAITVGTLSKFKTDLNYFLDANFKDYDGVYKVPEKYIAMAYKLPYFHEYNQLQQKLFDHTNCSVSDEKIEDPITLKFLTKLDPSTKKKKNILEYWFENAAGKRVVLEVNKFNTLLPLLDRILDQPITVVGKFYKRTNYLNQYYIAEKWNIHVED